MLPTLRYRDGYGSTTPQMRPMVERLQRALVRAGHDVDTDGLFGAGTRKAVRAFQKKRGMVVDGIAGPATWGALEAHLTKRETPPTYDGVPGFETFHGSLAWIHEWEGHVGKPYWPGGRSGVTLDPGFDLGYQGPEVTRSLFGGLLRKEQFDAVKNVMGLRGKTAKEASRNDPVLSSIRIRRTKAAAIMPHVAVRYWKAITKRFPIVAEEATPPSVQTVLLSLAYNRGARNRGLAVLTKSLEARDWLRAAQAVGEMQQDHSLRGIRIRRRQEADLIRHEIDFT